MYILFSIFEADDMEVIPIQNLISPFGEVLDQNHDDTQRNNARNRQYVNHMRHPWRDWCSDENSGDEYPMLTS